MATTFRVSNVRKRLLHSQEIGGPMSAPSIVTSASIECLKCGEKWTASEGAGARRLTQVSGGGIMVSCPRCGTADAVQPSEFQ
jgi:hypothetical protein